MSSSLCFPIEIRRQRQKQNHGSIAYKQRMTASYNFLQWLASDWIHEIPLKCTTRLNAPPKHVENRGNSQLLNFNNFTYYNKIKINFYNKDRKILKF
jgi:hypothetical protein